MFLDDNDSSSQQEEESSYESDDPNEVDKQDDIQFTPNRTNQQINQNISHSQPFFIDLPQSSPKKTQNDLKTNLSNDTLRTNRLGQQKFLLQQSSKQAFQTSFSQNAQFKSKFNQSNDDYDFNKLSAILFDNTQSQHEPAQFFYSIDSSLPQLNRDVKHKMSVKLPSKQFMQNTNQDIHLNESTHQEEKQEGFMNFKDSHGLLEQQEVSQDAVTTPPIFSSLNNIMFDVSAQNANLELTGSVEISQIIDMNNVQTIKDDKSLKYPTPLLSLQINDPRIFFESPSPQGGMIQCKIMRDRSGLNHFYPKYELYFSNTNRFLMSAEKKANTNLSYYLLSMHQKDLDRQSPFYLGKLRGVKDDFEFIMYDSGEDPKSKNIIRPERKEIGAIIFEKGRNNTKKPRDKIVILPSIDKPNNGDLLGRYYSNNHSDLTIYHNNPAIWDVKHQSHVLNFYGRVQEASIKNFQLINKDDPAKRVILQFGKISDKQFNLDFQYPLTPMQAFMIGLSSFDFKLQL